MGCILTAVQANLTLERLLPSIKRVVMLGSVAGVHLPFKVIFLMLQTINITFTLVK